MKYKSETILQGGETLLLRSLRQTDAQEAIAVCRRAAGETPYMMRYEDEWTVSVEREMEIIHSAENGAKSLMLGAFVEGRLVGVASFTPAHPADRARHRASLGISIVRAHWGKGIGTAMMRAMIEQAKTTALEMLELSVVASNVRARAMYEKLGFVQYGLYPRMMKYRDGTYADLILMLLDLRREI